MCKDCKHKIESHVVSVGSPTRACSVVCADCYSAAKVTRTAR